MYIHVRVFPGSKKEEIIQKTDDHFEFKIKEKAERGEANKKVLDIVRQIFPNAREIKIINGHHSPSKLLSVNLND